MAGKKTSSQWKCAAARDRQGAPLNAAEAAAHLGVRVRYLAGATYRPGGKRKRARS